MFASVSVNVSVSASVSVSVSVSGSVSVSVSVSISAGISSSSSSMYSIIKVKCRFSDIISVIKYVVIICCIDVIINMVVCVTVWYDNHFNNIQIIIHLKQTNEYMCTCFKHTITSRLWTFETQVVCGLETQVVKMIVKPLQEAFGFICV